MLYSIVFSPTGGTEKIVTIMEKAWQCEPLKIDISNPAFCGSQYTFQEEDVCLVAVPSYGGRVPEIVIKRINTMTGNQAKAILVVAYGNRAYEDTLIELNDALKQRNFTCVGAVTGIAEHSIMHKYGAGRPNASDEVELLAYAKEIKKHLEQEDLGDVIVPGDVPYRAYGGVPLKPSANKDCHACGLCARSCPVQAIPMDSPAKTDTNKCISCMRCIAICPQHARKLNNIMLMGATAKLKKACSVDKQNELFLNVKQER